MQVSEMSLENLESSQQVDDRQGQITTFIHTGFVLFAPFCSLLLQLSHLVKNLLAAHT